MTRALPVLLALSLALVLAQPPASAASHSGCRTLSSGGTACGEVEVFCGGATATGTSTTPVHWRLVVRTNHGSASDEAYGSAVVLIATTECWTDSCTQADLYANHELIVSSITLCM